jgi:hypothetical protein
MLRTICAEPTLWDAILPEQCLGLPPGLAEVDCLLDDPRFFEAPEFCACAEPVRRRLVGFQLARQFDSSNQDGLLTALVQASLSRLGEGVRIVLGLGKRCAAVRRLEGDRHG